MKVIEQVYRELLYQAIEKKRLALTQLELSSSLKTSISVVNYALRPLERMGAVSLMRRGLRVVDVEKALYYWASVRNPQKDVAYAARVELPVTKIEKSMPQDVVFAAYSAYKFAFNDVPADYSEVYVYSSDVEEVKRRFPPSGTAPNLFVLKADRNLYRYGRTTTAGHTFADLWNLKEWYAKDFLKALEAKIRGQ